jgi:hypothetical protein
MRTWYGRKTFEERRAHVARRDPERVRAADQARRPARKEAKDYALKKYANGQVAIALRSGKLQRGACEVCGAPDAQAHHDDYERALDIRWLCTEHHAAEHRVFT